MALTGGELGPGPGGARGQPDIGLGAGKAAFLAAPVIGAFTEKDRPAAVGAPGGIVAPAQAGADPYDSCRLARRPCHQGVVGVGHDHSPSGLQARLAPTLGDVADLVVAVELVAAQVEQHEHRRPDLRRHPAQPRLVHLQYGGCPGRPGGQCSSQARGHVGAQQVGDHRATPAIGCGQARGQELGSGRLAIGARDQHDLAAAGQHAKRGGVDGEDGVPADDRTRPAPSGPGKSAGAAAHHHRQARPEV